MRDDLLACVRRLLVDSLLLSFVSLSDMSHGVCLFQSSVFLFHVFKHRATGSLTFAPDSGRSSQTPGLGNSSPEKAPRTVLVKQMTQTRTMMAVRTSAITRKNAESSSAPNVMVAEATPPEELRVSMLVNHDCPEQ
jgi:hypothetical protein